MVRGERPGRGQELDLPRRGRLRDGLPRHVRGPGRQLPDPPPRLRQRLPVERRGVQRGVGGGGWGGGDCVRLW